MSKGLEALRRIDIHLVRHEETQEKEFNEYVSIIEKELKQAEENEKLLNVFKNALTIEHHEYSQVKIDPADDSVVGLVKQLYQIKQNEINKDMIKALREWVLKNAFPKELKALEIIRNIGILKPYETIGGQCWLETMCDATKITKDDYDLLKEVLL